MNVLSNTPELAAASVAKAGSTEGVDTIDAVCGAFSEALDGVQVGPDDDFFECGGDSLNAEALALLLSEHFAQEVQMSALLDYPTPRELVQAFCVQTDAPAEADAQSVPFFIVHGRMGYSFPRPEFRDGLKAGRQFTMFELPGLRDEKITPNRVEDIAKAYVAQLVAEHPSGDIFLSSFCRGAMIALEMAHQLAESGRPISKLALIDPSVAKSVRRRHAGRPDTLGHRIMLFPFSGRFTGVSTPTDFDDDRLLARRARLKALRHRVRMKLRDSRAALGLNVRENKARARGFNVQAMTQLTTCYDHYWPKAYVGPADVICSQERRAALMDTNGVWEAILPNRRVHPVLDEHHDIGSQIAAETLEAVFPRSEQGEAS